MTDNIFEIETAAIAMRICCSEDPGILLTAFSPVVSTTGGSSWCWNGLAFGMRCNSSFGAVCEDPITNVEHATAAQEQFAMMRGVWQGCPFQRLFVHHVIRPCLQMAIDLCPPARIVSPVLSATMRLCVR